MEGKEEIVKFIKGLCPKIIKKCIFSIKRIRDHKEYQDIDIISKIIKEKLYNDIELEFDNKNIQISMINYSNLCIVMKNFRLYSLIIPSQTRIFLLSCNINNLFTNEIKRTNHLSCNKNLFTSKINILDLSQNIFKKCDNNLKIGYYISEGDILLINSKLKIIYKK